MGMAKKPTVCCEGETLDVIAEVKDAALDELTDLAAEVAMWKDAYENLRDYAVRSGLDITCYGIASEDKPAAEPFSL